MRSWKVTDLFKYLPGLLSCLLVLAAASISSAAGFSPFCDFRGWGGAGRDDPMYESYMTKFAEQGMTALILINKKSEPPFPRVRRFLEDAKRRGVNVWVRTNRVTSKRGAPGQPNSTLDFGLDEGLQRETLEYLGSLAALSKEYPNLKGLVIGGEELVGAKINRATLARYGDISQKQLGFSIAGNLSDDQKIAYFDWLQKVQNDWYSRIWDTLKAQYPRLDLFIYPSHAAVCGGRLSGFPRPAYWDIHDLIVTRDKQFSVILPSYGIADPLGADLTFARTMYVRAATEQKVPYYIFLQFHRGRSRAPTYAEMEEQVMASVKGGASGVGFWPFDSETRSNIFQTDRQRWEDCFRAVAAGAKIFPQTPKNSGLYFVKPRYSQFWEQDDNKTLKIFALLSRSGLQPEFLLAEQILGGALPGAAKCFYLPETFKYEDPGVIKGLQSTSKRIFLGIGASEPFTPGRKPATPVYETMGLQKGNPSSSVILREGDVFNVDWKGAAFKLSLSTPPKILAVSDTVTPGTGPTGEGSKKGLSIAWERHGFVFLAASDFDLLSNANESNQNRDFLNELLFGK